MEYLKFDKKIYISFAVGIIVVIAIVCLVILNNTKDDFVEVDASVSQVSNNIVEESKEKSIYVHVIGEVNNPGLVMLTEGSRISDAINYAGGLTNNADIEKVNLAYVVEDGQKIIIPNINAKQDNNGEKEELISSNAGLNVIEETTVSKGKVNINTASQTELETIEGIGPSLANKIIQYRNTNGRFKSIEDLKNVPGIGESKFESMKSSVIAK